MSDIIPICRDAQFFHWILPNIFTSLSSQVPTRHRLLLLDVVIATIRQVPNVNKLQQLEMQDVRGRKEPTIEERCISIYSQLASDKSWRIRQGASEHLPELCEALRPDRRKRHASLIMTWIVALMTDSEISVREAFIDLLPKCLEHIPATGYEEQIANNLLSLSMDQSDVCRLKVAKTFIDTFRYGSLPNELLLLLIDRLCSKENEFCLIYVLKHLPQLLQLGPDFRKFVKNNIDLWQQDRRWRVRNAICQGISTIAEQYGARDFDKSVFKTILLKYYYDTAHDIRNECCKQLRLLTLALKIPYVSRELLPPLLSETRTYQHRHVAFVAARELADVFDTTTWLRCFEDCLLRGLTDKIPNIRLACCETINACFHKKLSRSSKLDSFRNKILLLLKDSDSDVVYYSHEVYRKFFCF